MDIGLVHTNLIYTRGAEKQLCELSYYLDKMGNDVTIYTFEKKEDYIFDNLLKNVNVVSLNKPWHINSSNMLVSGLNVPRWYKMIKELSKLIKNHDVLNLHNTPSNWVSHFTDIKTVWTCNEPPFLSQGDQGLTKYLLSPYRKVDNKLTDADLICVLDNRMEKIVGNLFPNSHIKSIGSGATLFRPINHKNNGFINIITVGPVVPQRRLFDIIKAVDTLNLSNVKIHFVGDIKDATYYNSIKDFANKQKIDVIFHGILSNDELYDLFDISDLAIMASEKQPWGIFPLETFLGNIPTLTSNQTGINEFVSNNDFIFKTGDIRDLSEKIFSVLNNPEFYQKKVEKISNEIDNNFSWKGYSKRFYNLLEETVK
ncbi:glycosyltransferase family 4 protein [Methanobrevibacter sp. UBA417]|jgi:glycosyltransferase involved in cell wall biosynthesis|uniref:glycosyltransferase family 4 protein n=1 Tax=Methanobrevibacter sp. UBA417 TaxID=1915487 RepID=UPI0039B98FEC